MIVSVVQIGDELARAVGNLNVRVWVVGLANLHQLVKFGRAFVPRLAIGGAGRKINGGCKGCGCVHVKSPYAFIIQMKLNARLILVYDWYTI